MPGTLLTRRHRPWGTPTRRLSAGLAALAVVLTAATALGPGRSLLPGAHHDAPAAARPVIRLVASPTPVVDASGTTWSPDAKYADGGRTWHSSAPIAGTQDDQLFQHERYGMRGYDVPVPASGWYRVTINDAEVYWRTAGRRVFDVVAEGVAALRGVDVAKAVGPDHAWSASFDTHVTDGSLTLRLPAKVDQPKITSISVVGIAGGEPAQGGPSATPTSGGSPFGSPLTGDPTSARGGPFGPASVWRTDIRRAPVAGRSPALVRNLVSQVAGHDRGVAAFNVWQYNNNVYTVGPTQQRVDVKWDDCQGKGHVPSGLFGAGGAFVSVPIPSDAVPARGNDSSMSVHQPSTDTLWSFWKLHRRADGWHACWGGRLEHASTSKGYFADGKGTTATGLAVEGGTVNIRDAQAGSIDHALSLVVVDAAIWSNFSWPAQRSDGADRSADAIPEGTRFRLDPSLDVDALHLHPIAAMIAHAAQTYGFIVTDKGGSVSVQAEGSSGVQAATGADPWKPLLAGRPTYDVLRGFPWDRLQALPRDYGKP